MAQLQEAWNKFNPRERMTAAGAGVVILAWLIGLVARGFGVGSIALLGAIAVIAVLYLKSAPNQNITWPIAPSLIVLGISALVALFALITLLEYLSYIGVLGISGLLALLLYVAGGALMVWGAWQEYQVAKPAMPNFSSTNTSTPSSSTAAPSAPPAAAPVAGAPPVGAAPGQSPTSTPVPPVTAVPLDDDEAPPA